MSSSPAAAPTSSSSSGLPRRSGPVSAGAEGSSASAAAQKVPSMVIRPLVSQVQPATTAPGFTTRCISRSPATGSVMKWSTSWATAASNVASPHGSSSAAASRTSALGHPRRARGRKAGRWVGRGHEAGTNHPGQCLGERSGAAAHVHHPHAGLHTGEAHEQRGEEAASSAP